MRALPLRACNQICLMICTPNTQQRKRNNRGGALLLLPPLSPLAIVLSAETLLQG